MATKLKFARALTFNECVNLILTTGHRQTIILKSEPGCGKTSMLAVLAERNGDKWRRPGDERLPMCEKDKYDYIYVDSPCKEMGDIAMNIPVHELRELISYISSLFRIRNGKLKIVMLDEFLKVNKLMKIVFTRLILERYVGDERLPDGSIVFATSNNTGEGLGDVIAAHEGNRVTIVDFKKPDHEVWGRWANTHGISALTRAWVALNPSALHSYTDLSDTQRNGNPFIYDPKKNNVTFVSPRSLEKNDIFVQSKHVLGEEVALAAMCGTVGQAAAESMHAFFLIEKDLIPVKKIIANPKGTPIPENAGALLMILFNAPDEIATQDDLSSFMQFVQRLSSKEWQSVFYTTICQSKKTVKLVKNNPFLSKWMLDNFYLFT